MKLLTFIIAFLFSISFLHAEIEVSILKSEFIFSDPKTASSHASTIVEVAPGKLVAAWFGGTKEKAPDVDIWLSHYDEESWSEPEIVATGNGTPCWNPVLFKMPSGELLLFYKIGPQVSAWKGYLKRTEDDGKTWSEAEELPEGILGPIKNKPLLLENGTLICGSSREDTTPNRVVIETSNDAGKTWKSFGPVPTDFPDPSYGMIQPALFTDPEGHLRMLCRPRHKLRKLCLSISENSFKTWAPATVTNLPNPDSAIDAITLKNGLMVLVYNSTESKRRRLDLAISKNGSDWEPITVLEAEEPVDGSRIEFSYPAIIQTQDGLIHITYTWNRQKIKHVVLDLIE